MSEVFTSWHLISIADGFNTDEDFELSVMHPGECFYTDSGPDGEQLYGLPDCGFDESVDVHDLHPPHLTAGKYFARIRYWDDYHGDWDQEAQVKDA